MAQGIPTTYKGVRFRSRLEARWAVFFDLCNWRWEYEPFDKNGWIPDFVLVGEYQTLVEVKPIIWPKLSLDETIYSVEKLEEINKVRRNLLDFESEAIILGASLPEMVDRLESHTSVGVLLSPYIINNVNTIEPDAAILDKGYGFPLDFRAYYGSYHHRMSGEADGDHHIYPPADGVPERYWKEAGNIVQWRADR